MDDIWLFTYDAGEARRTQVQLQQTALSLGLTLNSAKTDVLEGFEATREVRDAEHSAIDTALGLLGNAEPLEELIDRMLETPEKAPLTSLRFACKRIQQHDVRHRADDLLGSATRMPHAAMSLAPVFDRIFFSEDLQDWFIEFAESEWGVFEWTASHYLRMFSSNRRPIEPVILYAERAVTDPRTSLPLLATAAQRLAAWDPSRARAAIRAAVPHARDHLGRRVIALAALNAGETGATVKRWLRVDDANRPTLEMLEANHFREPLVMKDFENLSVD